MSAAGSVHFRRRRLGWLRPAPSARSRRLLLIAVRSDPFDSAISVVRVPVAGCVACATKSATAPVARRRPRGQTSTVLLMGSAPKTSVSTTAIRPTATSSAKSPRYRLSIESLSNLSPTRRSRLASSIQWRYRIAVYHRVKSSLASGVNSFPASKKIRARLTSEVARPAALLVHPGGMSCHSTSKLTRRPDAWLMRCRKASACWLTAAKAKSATGTLADAADDTRSGHSNDTSRHMSSGIWRPSHHISSGGRRGTSDGQRSFTQPVPASK